jgi:hypothetical protein
MLFDVVADLSMQERRFDIPTLFALAITVSHNAPSGFELR